MLEQEELLVKYIFQFKNGDKEAYRNIYHLIKLETYRMIRLLTSSNHDVDEIVQSVYVQLWKSLHTFDLERPFNPWIHGIIIKQIQDYNRKAWRRFRLNERSQTLHVAIARSSEPGTDLVHTEISYELIEAIQKLSYKLRVVIILRYYQDHTLEEIADILQIPVGSVKSRLHLAIKKLRKIFMNYPKELANYVNGTRN